MKTNKEKLNKHGWKSRFVRLTSLMMLCFNVLSAPLTAIGMVAIAGVSVTLVVSCDKDEDGQNQEQPPQPQKHNVELVYGNKPSTNWQHIEMDTIYKYNSDPTVDTIFMIPEYYNQFTSLSASGLKNLANKLRERHNVNPNKVFGKGELQLHDEAVAGHPEILKFFADTLKYDITYYSQAKSR